MTASQSGLTIVNVPSYWIELPQGLVLLVAVLLDQTRRRRGTRREPGAVIEAEAATAAP